MNKDFWKGLNTIAMDFDDTLVDEEFSILKRWDRVLSKYSFLSRDLKKIFRDIYKEKGKTYKHHIDDLSLKLCFNKKISSKMIDDFHNTPSDEEKVFDGGVELVLFLKSIQFKLGIITNGLKSYQESRIRLSGMYDFFDFVYYGDLNKKPDPNAFTRCIKDLKIDVNKFMYIGNDFTEDLGALDLGIKVCLINPHNTKDVYDKKNLLVKNSLSELLNDIKISYS